MNESLLQRAVIIFKPPVINMLFLGFSAGLPILLIFGTLSLWLREAGLERSAVTYFSWAALGYSFKFVWAPLIDKLPIPFLTRVMGKRRSWLLVSQLFVAGSIVTMAMSNPVIDNGIYYMAIGAVLLGFSSATQDIVIDAYRIEAADQDTQALMSSNYVAGYRIGMIFAGAVALYLAEFFGSSAQTYLYQAWQNAYLFMALLMLVGIATTLCINEPSVKNESKYLHKASDYVRFIALFAIIVATFIICYLLLSPLAISVKSTLLQFSNNKALAGFIASSLRLIACLISAIGTGFVLTRLNLVPRTIFHETYIEPVTDFFSRYKKAAVYILCLICLYRISDIVLGAVANIFYQDMGFTKSQIATVTKAFGLWMTILGGMLGGYLSIRFGMMKILTLGAGLTVITNLLFILLAKAPGDVTLLYIVISADNITAGLASAALIAYLSSLVNLQFTAIQYAIFSSIMTLFPKIIAGYSGSMIDILGYEKFFLYVSILGLPVLILIWLTNKAVSKN